MYSVSRLFKELFVGDPAFGIGIRQALVEERFLHSDYGVGFIQSSKEYLTELSNKTCLFDLDKMRFGVERYERIVALSDRELFIEMWSSVDLFLGSELVCCLWRNYLNTRYKKMPELLSIELLVDFGWVYVFNHEDCYQRSLSHSGKYLESVFSEGICNSQLGIWWDNLSADEVWERS